MREALCAFCEVRDAGEGKASYDPPNFGEEVLRQALAHLIKCSSSTLNWRTVPSNHVGGSSSRQKIETRRPMASCPDSSANAAARALIRRPGTAAPPSASAGSTGSATCSVASDELVCRSFAALDETGVLKTNGASRRTAVSIGVASFAPINDATEMRLESAVADGGADSSDCDDDGDGEVPK
eukprot:scaffold21923_cov112-Isochrysis_galbana.AAC.3